jgi:uncharacterized protein involved in exopolysaccharide biosynthesis
MDEFDEVQEQSELPEFLMDPRGVIRRRWPWMLAVFLVTSIAAGAFLATMPQTYEAKGRLLIARQRMPEDFVRPTSLERVPDLVDAIIGEILSRDSLIEVAETTNFPERMSIDGSMTDLIDQMRSRITVEPDLDLEGQRYRYGAGEEIFILAIRFESSDPVAAADVANELLSRFIASHLGRQIRKAKLTGGFLRQEAERAEAELAQQRARITDFTEAHRGELPSELETKLARLERLQLQSQSLALQISDAEGRLLVLQSEEPIQETLDELRVRLLEARTIYTDEHPNVIALRRQIEALEAESASERAGAGTARMSADPAVAAVRREVEVLRAQAVDIERQIRELDAAVSAIPAREEELLALEQEEDLLREHFIEASRKVQDAELAESLEQADQGVTVSRLDAAIPPAQPKRNRWKFAALAAGAVLGASVLAGTLLELVDPIILSSRQLETETGMTPLGVIPKIR